MPDSTSPLDDALDALAAARPRVGGTPCAVARLLSTLPEETGERIRKLIDESDVQTTLIAETLERAGYPISYQGISRHRRRLTQPGSGCRCES